MQWWTDAHQFEWYHYALGILSFPKGHHDMIKFVETCNLRLVWLHLWYPWNCAIFVVDRLLYVGVIRSQVLEVRPIVYRPLPVPDCGHRMPPPQQLPGHGQDMNGVGSRYGTVEYLTLKDSIQSKRIHFRDVLLGMWSQGNNTCYIESNTWPIKVSDMNTVPGNWRHRMCPKSEHIWGVVQRVRLKNATACCNG